MERIADNLHGLDPRVARALATRDPAPLRDLVQRLVDAGADRIDLNPGPCPANVSTGSPSWWTPSRR